ncbi:MAG: hypothetical protein AABZ13_08285 [Planctomycetota bacterium]
MSETTEDYLYFKADFEKTEENSKVLIERLRVEAKSCKQGKALLQEQAKNGRINK